MSFRIAVLTVLACLAAVPAQAKKIVMKGDGWKYVRNGNTEDVTRVTTPGFVLEGGGHDVGLAYRWMCHRSGNGDFLVIRASGTPAYNPYIQRLCPHINSVATLIIKSRAAASDPFVVNTIHNAEALFIAGGDQANYVNFWQGTPVNDEIDTLAAHGVPIGGTSAGNAIMAQYAFSALNDTVVSAQALANPFNRHMTIDDGFLHLTPLLQGIITDDHFVTRDRMGRFVAFLARISHDGLTEKPRGIAVNERAAFLMEADGKGTLVGQGSAYFVTTPGGPEFCEPRKPLTYKNLDVYKITQTGTFDVSTWSGTGGAAYSISATDGVMSSTQSGGSLY